MRFALSSLLFLLFGIPGFSQSLEIILADESDNAPIADVHLFITNATFGGVSDDRGFCALSIPPATSEELIISHIAYNTRVLGPEEYALLGKGDTLFLTPNGFSLEDVVVTQKRDNKWKKNLKVFEKAFLGVGDEANKCSILNPEVLRFENNEKGFRTTAVDLLKIRNNFLGYDVDFLLKELIVEKNGSKVYQGYAQFVDLYTAETNKKIERNRRNVFLRSPQHFFQTLIKNELEQNAFKLRIASYDAGVFKTVSIPTQEELISIDEISGYYKLSFNEFLEITNQGVRKYIENSVGTVSGLESTKFNNSQGGQKEAVQYAVSQIYKIEPYLLLHPNGVVINNEAVREYGFWATQRMANALPWDYVLEKDKESQKNSTAIATKTKVGKTENGVTNKTTSLDLFKQLIYGKKSVVDRRGTGPNTIAEATLAELRATWKPAYIPPLLDLLRMSKDKWLTTAVEELLAEKVGTDKVPNYFDGISWLWNKPPVYDDYYADLQGELYQHVDAKFKNYFVGRQPTAKIRLDEIVWGGVVQDGIPPLRYPGMLSVAQAEYLGEEDIVFGIEINGIAHAYPKRILAWHEFFVDSIAGVNLSGVYCTLCGTVIIYDNTHQGITHKLGTSGFLYRSNKLMYDQATQSLWSTIDGSPVLGPLADQNINLKTLPVVTTTWGDWKAAHPGTKVLSINTGHQRNYDEGVAYKDYFATDEIMFPVPKVDKSLKNKAEVLIVRAPGYEKDPLAVSIDFLQKKQLYQDQIGEQPFVIITEATGASRAYARKNISFKSYKKGVLQDDAGNRWTIKENELLGPTGERLARIPAHNIFWFAWINSYANTRLVK